MRCIYFEPSLIKRTFGEKKKGTRDLQSSELGHVVEAGDWDAADVVVVQRSVKRQKRQVVSVVV